MTVGAIVKAQNHMPETPQRWVVCGGGRHNAALMQLLSNALPAPVFAAEALGFDGDSIEAEAWAYLAVRSLRGLPLTFPGTTGVGEPTTGGVISEPGCN